MTVPSRDVIELASPKCRIHPKATMIFDAARNAWSCPRTYCKQELAGVGVARDRGYTDHWHRVELPTKLAS